MECGGHWVNLVFQRKYLGIIMRRVCEGRVTDAASGVKDLMLQLLVVSIASTVISFHSHPSHRVTGTPCSESCFSRSPSPSLVGGGQGYQDLDCSGSVRPEHFHRKECAFYDSFFSNSLPFYSPSQTNNRHTKLAQK